MEKGELTLDLFLKGVRAPEEYEWGRAMLQ